MPEAKPRPVKRHPPADDGIRADVADHLADRMGPAKCWILASEVADSLDIPRTVAGQVLAAMFHEDHPEEPVTVAERWEHSTNYRYRVEVDR
jgi:hypothetical protein